MSRLKNIKKDNSKNNPSLIDAIHMVDPSNKNTYLDFLFKFIKNTLKSNKEYKEKTNQAKEELIYFFGISKEKLKNYNDIEIICGNLILNYWFGYHDIKSLWRFHKEREKGRIKSVDITKLNDFQDLNKVLSLLDLKDVGGELEKQVYKFYDDEEWLIILPLTHLASQKYGSNTKWCTTHQNHEYFKKFASKGNILYTINKITGFKVATFYSLNKFEPELSFWSASDERVDSMSSGLPNDILQKIKNFIDSSTETNLSMLDKNQFQKEMDYYKINENVNESLLINDPIQLTLNI